jgi:uncharacterized protein (DUF433 family)
MTESPPTLHNRSRLQKEAGLKTPPVVRGTRVPVHMLGDVAEQGASREGLLEDYPALTPKALDAALLYARMYTRRAVHVGRPGRTGSWSGRRREPFRCAP